MSVGGGFIPQGQTTGAGDGVDGAAVGSRPGSGGRRSALTICGGGNAGHALAVVASQNFDGDIDWLVGSEEKADLLRRGVSTGGLRSTGALEARADRLRTISAEPAEVIPNADMVLIVVPAFVHAAVLGRIRPHVSDATVIGCFPTRGGFEFQAMQLTPRDEGVRRGIFGLQTLPWSTRVVTPGEVVNIGAVKAQVVLAALPAGEGAGIAARLTTILRTEIVATDDFLSLTIGNPGQFIHPGLMYGHFHSWQGEEFDEDGIPMFYAQATDEMGDVVAGLSSDAVAVARELEAQSGGALDLQKVTPVLDWLRVTYAHVTEDLSSVGTCFRTGPIQARKAPVTEVASGNYVPDFGYRYLTEDVPFGLVATRALAEIAGVETPTIDAVVGWAQSAMQKTYLVNGKLEGPDTGDLPIPQNHGISSVSELAEWYGVEASEAPRSRASSKP
ncbi:MAG TPA: NAD/NADP octopine/nopaline dehydrogenase family protein [Gaiellaceae bacterium]|nr:NAD/NADP octopine/nopaline dehydrogenase family protein [Gaiellaceae bacterium]